MYGERKDSVDNWWTQALSKFFVMNQKENKSQSLDVSVAPTAHVEFRSGLKL